MLLIYATPKPQQDMHLERYDDILSGLRSEESQITTPCLFAYFIACMVEKCIQMNLKICDQVKNFLVRLKMYLNAMHFFFFDGGLNSNTILLSPISYPFEIQPDNFFKYINKHSCEIL